MQTLSQLNVSKRIKDDGIHIALQLGLPSKIEERPCTFSVSFLASYESYREDLQKFSTFLSEEFYSLGNQSIQTDCSPSKVFPKEEVTDKGIKATKKADKEVTDWLRSLCSEVIYGKRGFSWEYKTKFCINKSGFVQYEHIRFIQVFVTLC